MHACFPCMSAARLRHQLLCAAAGRGWTGFSSGSIRARTSLQGMRHAFVCPLAWIL